MHLPSIKVDINNYQELFTQFSRSSLLDDSVPITREEIHNPRSLSPPTRYVPPSTPRLFALIIGINYYGHVQSLRGAVADALAMKEYLETHLEVPSYQIQLLLNKAASRVGIIEALQRLQTDRRIGWGDSILVYYAGHGSELPSPPGWEAGGPNPRIQVLVPQDYCSTPGNDIPPIPDRTLSALLEELANAKGNNISVILDCCYSGSGTRKFGGKPAAPARSVVVAPNVTADTDRNIWDASGRGSNGPPIQQRGDLRSHILLAACSAEETAKEEDGRGVFTKALLKLLRTLGPEQLRYRDVLQRIDMIPNQNPRCEGVFQERCLFDGKAPGLGNVYFSCRSEKGRFVLDGGAAHGISNGAEFKIYSGHENLKKPLGVLVVDAVDAFTSVLVTPPGLPSIKLARPGIALQSKAGQRDDLRLYIPLDNRMLPLFEAVFTLMGSRGAEFRNIRLVERQEDAHVEASLEGDELVFIHRDERITGTGVGKLLRKTPLDSEELITVLQGLAHFWWELNRINLNDDISRSVQVEFYQLQHTENFDRNNRRIKKPLGENLLEDGRIELSIENRKAIYGMKLINSSGFDLYPYLFYFDNSDLSITAYYESPNSGRSATDPPLKKNGGTLAIGYGEGGSPAFSYWLPDILDVDSGFLKLFLSTKPVDLSSVCQHSPFEQHRSEDIPAKRSQDTWGALLTPVIQRRLLKEANSNLVNHVHYAPSVPQSNAVFSHPSLTVLDRTAFRPVVNSEELHADNDQLKAELMQAKSENKYLNAENQRLAETIAGIQQDFQESLDRANDSNARLKQELDYFKLDGGEDERRAKVISEPPKRANVRKPSFPERAMWFWGFSK